MGTPAVNSPESFGVEPTDPGYKTFGVDFPLGDSGRPAPYGFQDTAPQLYLGQHDQEFPPDVEARIRREVQEDQCWEVDRFPLDTPVYEDVKRIDLKDFPSNILTDEEVRRLADGWMKNPMPYSPGSPKYVREFDWNTAESAARWGDARASQILLQHLIGEGSDSISLEITAESDKADYEAVLEEEIAADEVRYAPKMRLIPGYDHIVGTAWRLASEGKTEEADQLLVSHGIRLEGTTDGK
jgi:hypothetical protein